MFNLVTKARKLGSSAQYASQMCCPVLLGMIVFACLVELPHVSHAAETSLVYVTPRGVTMTVTEKGLSTIRKGFGAVVDGEWTAFNAESRFKDGGTDEVKVPAPTEKTITVISPKEAEVRHAGGDAVCVYRYTFDGDDVLIVCRFENQHASATVQTIGFTGLTAHFARPPEGVMPVQNAEFFKEQGISTMHPSSFSPLGGGYAMDKNVGIGVSPANSRAVRTLMLWDYANWNTPERDRVLERKLHYLVHSPIPPGGTLRVGLKMRVSPELNWQYLMEPYRDEFQKIYGKVQYKADGRWIATDNLVEEEKKDSTREPRRPLPKRSDDDRSSDRQERRSKRGIDRSQGAQDFCDALIPRLTESNGQGVIFRGYGIMDGPQEAGLDEFNLLPPDVDDNWDRITEQFSSARLKLGVASRPLDVNIRANWTDRQSIRLNPMDPAHRDFIWGRYEQMIERGCTLFTLEGFGDSLEDVELMRWLREKMGPEIGTFAERPCDAVLVFSGGMSNATLKTSSSAGLERGYRMALGEHVWQICQWLAPGAQLAGQLTEIQGNLNDALETPERYFYSRRIVPILPLADFKRAPAIKKLQPLYVSDNGAWLPSSKKE